MYMHSTFMVHTLIEYKHAYIEYMHKRKLDNVYANMSEQTCVYFFGPQLDAARVGLCKTALGCVRQPWAV